MKLRKIKFTKRVSVDGNDGWHWKLQRTNKSWHSNGSVVRLAVGRWFVYPDGLCSSWWEEEGGGVGGVGGGGREEEEERKKK